MNRYRVIVAIVCLLASVMVSAQTASIGFTPYSMFGVGDMTRQGSTYSQQMAGFGTGDRNIRYINTINPAAVTEIDQKAFMMDFGLRQNNVLYQTTDSKSANNTFNLDHLVLAFPIAKIGALHFGVNTYSSTGYSFQSMEESDELIAEVGDLRYFNHGDGGIYRGFLGAGFKISRRLSLGVDGNFYFGNISHYSIAYFGTSSAYRSIDVGNLNTYKGISAKFGAQYQQPIGKRRELVLGATYHLGTKMGGKTVNYAFGTASATDTIKYEVSDLQGFRIPAEISVGISYRNAEKFMVGFDYTRQNWYGTDFEKEVDVDVKGCCAQSFRLGLEWTPERYDIRYYFKRISYHAGAYYEQQYLSFKGHQIAAYGFTLGVSLPVSRYFNSVNIGVDLGQRGTTADGLIRERYAMLTLGFNFHDVWFIKQLYD